jgi:hypothetical protein
VSRVRLIEPQAEPVWLHGFARLDSSHRLKDVAVFAALALDSTSRLTVVNIDGDRAVLRVDPSGELRMDGRCRLLLGDSLRRSLHIPADGGVLLSANATCQELLVMSCRAIERLVA